jgi:hypothetical protein
MSFKVNINKEYFHKVLEISEGKYSPDEMERILVEDLRKKGFTLGKSYPVLAIKESERNTLFFIPDDNDNMNWHNKIGFLYAGEE